VTNASPSHAPSPYFIEFRNVYKSFDEQPVLTDVSFNVRRGETLAIMGRSGVGKSVTLRHIIGFLKPDSGRVLVNGQDITDWDEDQLAPLRQRVTMVFQSGALFDSLSVSENVAYPLWERQLDEEVVTGRTRELLQMLEVEEFADLYPADISTWVKRAVAIGRALALDPEAVLYDEPTTQVDPVMAAHVGDLILKLKRQLHKTAIVVTHDTHLARKLADRIVFLHEGRVILFGELQEFVDSPLPVLRDFRLKDELIPILGDSA
jgi:phospholipid/cholesterol/gamma-HCH transport system ATP-binding protein